MKLLTTLIYLLLAYSSNCENDFMSKFHQHGYKIKEYRVEIPRYDKSIFNMARAVTFKYNRTTIAINITANSKIDLFTRNLEVLVQAYKFASNEYRTFPIRFQVNAAKMLVVNPAGLQSVLECGNVTQLLTFSKNVTYHVCNYIPDDSLLPPLIPTGSYKVSAGFLMYPEKEIAVLDSYLEIYIPIKYT